MKQWIRNNRAFLVFLLLLGISRGALADWNYIPSGSMRPTLLEGDVVLVNRIAYDLKLPLTNVIVAHMGEPRRGDIVIFKSPREGTRLIKRLVGVPGDLVEMRDKILTVNGQTANYAVLSTPEDDASLRVVAERTSGRENLIQWDRDAYGADSFGPVRIPDDHFLMLGDNRDHSADSRYFGLVRRELLIGRGERILVSADLQHGWLPRFSRFGRRLQQRLPAHIDSLGRHQDT